MVLVILLVIPDMHIHIFLVNWCSIYSCCEGVEAVYSTAGSACCMQPLVLRPSEGQDSPLDCMTLRGLILSNFIIWCAMDYTIICPSEMHYGHQSIWFGIVELLRRCDINPGVMFPEAQGAVKARGAGRDFLTMRRELNINRILTRTGSSLEF